MALLPQNILVLGLGELGLPVTSHIAQAAARQENPTSVSVLLRPSSITDPSPARAKDLKTVGSLNVTPVPGDLAASSRVELISLFEKYDCIISCTGFVGGPETLLKTVHAVVEAQVPYFIPWQFGVDYDQVGYGSAQKLWDTQLDVRKLLRELPQVTGQAAKLRTQWTIVQTGIFTSFLFEPWFEVVDVSDESQPTVRALGAWNNRVSTTSPDDIGRLTATVLFDPSLRNQIVKTGDTISYAQLADLMEDVLGRAVKREVLELDHLERNLRERPTDNIKMYQVAFAKGTGCSWDVETTINHKRKIQMQTIRDYAVEKFSRQHTPVIDASEVIFSI